MAVSFITFFSYSFGSILYNCVYSCMFCMLLFKLYKYLSCILIVMYVPFWVFCFIVLFCVLFLCKCVLYYCHRVSTRLQLTNVSYIIGCPETSASNYSSTLREIPKERRSHLIVTCICCQGSRNSVSDFNAWLLICLIICIMY